MSNQKVIGICCGRSCCNRNQKLWEVAKENKNPDVVFEEAQCLDNCEQGPNVRVDEKGVRRKETGMTEERLKEIMNE